MKTLLVVDDDPKLRHLLVEFLKPQGYAIHPAENGSQMKEVLDAEKIDLIILDLMLRHESGFDLLKALQKSYPQIPCLILSAKDKFESRIKGLEMGAKDYLAKPFHPRELSLRIQNLLADAQISKNVNRYQLGAIHFDLNHQTLSLNANLSIDLSSQETELMKLFCHYPNQTLSKNFIAQQIKGSSGWNDSRAIDAAINRLKQKLHQLDQPTLIQTDWGKGIRLNAQVTKNET